MFKEETKILRQIPSVDYLTNIIKTKYEYPASYISYITRNYLENLKKRILAGEDIQELENGNLRTDILINKLKSKIFFCSSFLKKVINATGVILHTGLGRAVIPPSSVENLCRDLRGYCLLEMELETGKRSLRDFAVSELLKIITGAEDATVVNNNAGAILLALSSLTKNKEVIVSRGQLVEIGGSFRIPEIMKESGATLVEVGCTNRTHEKDYINSITPNTAALLHVHRSNFKISGFTKEVSVKTLQKIAKKHNLLLIQDAGSGVLFDLSEWGFSEEPVISQSIKSGVDIVTFSGDKLLGGCQAGIIVGKKNLINKIRKHPLTRALRLDKIILSILKTTLFEYLKEKDKAIKNIPTLNAINFGADIIKDRVLKIVKILQNSLKVLNVKDGKVYSRIGSGALPTKDIESHGIIIDSNSHISVNKLSYLLRSNKIPIIARIQDESLILDLRTVFPEEEKTIIETLLNIDKDLKSEGPENF